MVCRRHSLAVDGLGAGEEQQQRRGGLGFGCWVYRGRLTREYGEDCPSCHAPWPAPAKGKCPACLPATEPWALLPHQLPLRADARRTRFLGSISPQCCWLFCSPWGLRAKPTCQAHPWVLGSDAFLLAR